MSRTARRRVILVLGATILALTGALVPARAPVARAASDGLVLSTAATYTLVPARHVVRVRLDITARNEKPNVTAGGIVTKYFYEGARVAIQPEARSVQATSGGVRLTATTKPADGYSILEVRFQNALFYHQSATVRVTFDLPGGAPRSASDIRVGSAFATFVAWAFGDTGSVRVVVPAGFTAEATGSTATKTTSGGATIFRATGIADIGTWYLVVNADRESALTSARIDLSGGVHVVIRAWPEDAAWKKQVTELLTRGLPKLVEQTGLAWPVTTDLSVFEVHTPLLEGYAGVFLEREDKIEISEDLDGLTILHEASHAWFNSGLFDGRWINEGFADTYAARALDALGKGGQAPGNVSPTDKASVRLVDWTHPGRITDEATNAREHYGYDASWTVIRALVADIGEAGMRDVLRAAQARRIAYAGSGAPETVGGTNDWRRFLDLLDEVGRSTTAHDVFRRWVLTNALADQLDVRAAARTAYATLVAGGAGWLPPLFVRGPMSDWNFALATTRMTDALALLARRDEIVALAGRLGVTVPADLRTAYESARDTLDDANRVADAETAALRALDTAIGAVAAPRAPLVTLGLLGTTPEAALADARAAFSAGRPQAAAQAIAVTALIDGAVEVGRGRLVAAIVGLVAVIVLLIVAIVLVRRRRRRHPALVARPAEDMAHPMPSTGPDAAPPYATLADQSLGPLDGDPVAGPTDMIETPEPTDDAEPILEPETEPAPAETEPAPAETEPPPADRGDAP